MQRSIRTKILLSFFLLISFIAAALLYSQYYFSKRTAYETTENTFILIANNIANKQKDTKETLANIIHATLQNRDIYKPISSDIYHPFLNHLIYLLNTNSDIYATYFTNNDTKMYELINITHYPKLFQQLQAPQKTKWAIVLYKDKKIKYFFLNEHLQILASNSSNEQYTIAQRPWYKAALQKTKIAYTGPYIFAQLNELGFTYSASLKNSRNVFAIDYTLEDLHTLLQKQKINARSEIFLFDHKGKILISSNIHADQKQTSLDPEFQKQLALHNEKKVLKYTYKNTNYYAIYKKIDNGLYLGMKFPSKILMAPYVKNLLYSFYIALGFLFLALLYIFYATKKIVAPIDKLIVQNTYIKKRNFEDVKPIETNIIEFQELSHSLVDMAQSIAAYQKAQKELLNSLVKLIAEAIDAKSSYTGGHCERVPIIASMLLETTNSSKDKDFLDAFRLAAWLHDCGKVTTPEYVVDKATKLETIYNRIHEIRLRFEILWRDTQIEYFESLLANKDRDQAFKDKNKKQKELLDDFTFIAQCNIGNEFMSQEDIQRIKSISKRTWLRNFDKTLGLSQEELQRYDSTKKESLPVYETLLADKEEHIIKRKFFDYKSYEKEGFKEEVPEYLYNYGEIYNLCIQKGTLTQEERYKINEHVIMSIKMLEKIPFPKELSKVAEYAGQHHERLDGNGYPRKVTAEKLSIPSRILAIADIFEALTAADRSYKKAKTLSQALDIMHNMVQEQHIDKELFQLFIQEKIYLTYAKQHLKKEQIDSVNERKYLS